MRVLGEALAAGRVALDEAAVDRCNEALPSAFAGCDWVTPGQPLPPDACRALTRGLVSAGGLCRSSLECVPPLHCEGATPTEAGRCSAALREGAACRASIDNLAALSFERELEQTHPSCSRAAPIARARGARQGSVSPGGACRTDFDCVRGGCAAGVCGAKCAVSMADAARSSSLPPLALPRRSKR